MAKIKNENREKYNLARDLYLAGVAQTEIARRLKVSNPTINDWKNKGKWKDLEDIYSTTRSELLQNAYKQLQAIDKQLEENNWIPTKTLNDAKNHALKQIAQFEDTPIRVFIDCFEELIKYTARYHSHEKREVTNLCNEFILHLQSQAK